jgi:catechol 2,3-dioxygenase
MSDSPVPVAHGSGIDPGARIGTVTLVVSDLERALAFYAGVLGLWMHRVDDGVAVLGAGEEDMVVLVEDREAVPAVGCTGLFHLAIRVPSRLELARSIQRLILSRGALTGFADHLVCESIYLDDPDGNGIEVYADRPREEWPLADGHVQMATDPLDLYGAIARSDGRSVPPQQVDVGTVVGHVHLCVADVEAAEVFYRELVGLDVMVRFPASSMLAAGGYHHQIGVNHAHTEGAPAPQAGSLGMRHFELIVNDTAPLVARLGELAEPHPLGFVARDPSGNRIVVRAADRRE